MEVLFLVSLKIENVIKKPKGLDKFDNYWFWNTVHNLTRPSERNVDG